MNACSRLIVSALLAAASAGASALTTPTYSWTDIACGIHARDGSTTPQPCTPGDPSFTAVLQPGEYLFVTANLNYVYHDDGLALPPGGLYGFQMDSRGEVIRFFDHEAAGLFFLSNPCNDRGCEQRPYWFGGFSGPPPRDRVRGQRRAGRPDRQDELLGNGRHCRQLACARGENGGFRGVG